MAHYAFIDENNIVTEVIVGIDENETIEALTTEEWYSQFKGMRCVRTSYNANIRGVFAGVGYSYDEDLDLFVVPKPFVSWLRDGSFWKAPIEMPEDGKFYLWNEELGAWVEAEII
jgi:hypothetical protein